MAINIQFPPMPGAGRRRGLPVGEVVGLEGGSAGMEIPQLDETG